MNFMRRSVVGVVRTCIVGRSRSIRSSAIFLTNDNKPTNVLLQVSNLYQGLNLITELETFYFVMPLCICGTCSILIDALLGNHGAL